MKSLKIAYILWFVGIFGCMGLHRIYLKKYNSAILWLLSFGLGGVGSLLDLFLLEEMVANYNTMIYVKKQCNSYFTS